MKKVLFMLFLVTFISLNGQTIYTEYENLGEIHNQFLDNVLKNFNTVGGIDYDEKVNAIHDFNNNYANTIGWGDNDVKLLKKIFNKTKYDVDNVKFYKKSFDSRSGSYVKINELKTNGLIDDFSFVRLTTLLKACENKVDLVDLTQLVNKLREEADSHYGGKNTDKSRILAMSLQIAHSSVLWWNANRKKHTNMGGGQSINDYDLPFIAPWLAADAVGAVISGAVAAGAQYATTGEVGNWGAVGISALGGAIVGSTGAIGKIAKWLF